MIPKPRRVGLIGGVLMIGYGCLFGGPSQVSPDEIPDLEARLARQPNSPETTLRYSAALFAAGRCDSATVVARRGMELRPADALGPLIVGQCQEQGGDYRAALRTYGQYVNTHPNARGTSAIRARELIARREYATATAREALANEQQLVTQAPEPDAIAVLPFTVTGDSSYQPLARGMAQMVMSDLGILQRFRIVERIELRALLDEMDLGQTGRVDERTAARVGLLVRAGRLVQGLAFIPEQGPMRLEGSVVQADGEVSGSDAQTGRFRDLMQLEKQFVLGIVQRLGYALSEAERQLILENGTRNLAAFLAYSRGLEAEELGDYNTAALHFGQAVQADPAFGDARTRHQANSVAPSVQGASASQVTQVASTNAVDPTSTPEPIAEALVGAISDVAPTTGEQTTQSTTATTAQQGVGHVATTAGNTTISNPPPPDVLPPPTLTATIRIIFRIP